MARYWRILKWVLIGTALAVLLMMGAMGGGLYWLSVNTSRENPIDLVPYIPKLQGFFAGRGLNITADKLDLYYDTAPVLRIEGLNVLGPDGNLAVFTEQAAVKLANGRLLRLMVSPKVIEAKGVTLRLVRGTDDVVRIAGLGLNTKGAAQTNPKGVVEWLEKLPSDRLWGRLKNVRVQGLTLLVRDDVQRAEWVLEDGRLSLDRYAGRGERGSLLANVRRIVGPHLSVPKGVKGISTPVLVTLERDASGHAPDQVQVEAKFGTLNAQVVGDYLPTQLQNLVTGQGSLALGSVLTRGNRLGLPWLTLRLKNATLTMPAGAGYTQPFKLPQLEATLSYRPSPTDELHVRNFSFTSARGNLFVISGTVVSLTTNPTLALSGFSPGGDVQAITDFFPDADPQLIKTSQWLRQNIQGAAYRNLVAYSTLRLKAFPGCGDTCGGLFINADILQGTVKFTNDLPPAIIASSTTPARFYWRGQTLAVSAPEAKLAGQRAQSVWVSLDNIFSPSPTMLVVSGSLAGPVQDVISNLNSMPDINGAIPGTYAGTHRSVLHAMVLMPHQITPTFASTTLVVKGVVQNLNAKGLPFVGPNGLSTPVATLTLTADKTLTLRAAKAALGGGNAQVMWQQNIQPKTPANHALALVGQIPASWLQQNLGARNISGTGMLGIALRATESVPTQWSFNIATEAQNAALTLAAANYRKASGAPFSLLAQGVYADATPQTSGTLNLKSLTIKGTNAAVAGSGSFPLGGWVTGAFNFPTLKLNETNISATLHNRILTLRGASLDLRGLNTKAQNQPPVGLVLDAQVAQLILNNGVLRPLTFNANVRNGAWDITRLQGQTAGGSLNIRRSNKGLEVNLENAGAVLQALGLYARVKGGKIFGTLRGPSHALAGELKITDFELKNPPTFLKILGLLSLEQLVAGTDTTKFTNGVIPLRLTPEALHINAARFTGPSMDLRLNGVYERQTEQLNIQGNLAPAIPLNRLVSKIPLLGTLLTGSQDGLVVADFRIKGPAQAPEVGVQPLSVLTPGLLKDLFRGGTPNPTPMTR